MFLITTCRPIIPKVLSDEFCGSHVYLILPIVFNGSDLISLSHYLTLKETQTFSSPSASYLTAVFHNSFVISRALGRWGMHRGIGHFEALLRAHLTDFHSFFVNKCSLYCTLWLTSRVLKKLILIISSTGLVASMKEGIV
jgi:hypothetical protein